MIFNLRPRLSSDAQAEAIERGWRLWIPGGPATRYRLAQLDDHVKIPRARYPYRAPMQLELEARASAEHLPGTWGFGLWNDPFGFSFAPGNGFFRLPALPNAVWFFHSSPANYLSFRDDKPGNGLLAQVFSSPKFDPLLLRAGATLPFSRRAARRLLSRMIGEDATRIDDPDQRLRFDITAWHRYGIEWQPHSARLLVDGVCMLETSFSPAGPLGIVIWIDNQRAAFTPEGKISFGLERNSGPAWLEIRDLAATT